MSDRDTSNAAPSGQGASSGAEQHDDFNARTVMINQDVLGAARAEVEQMGAQQAGSAQPEVPQPGAQPQPGAVSWRPEPPAAPVGPPSEAQTRAYPAGAGASAGVPPA